MNHQDNLFHPVIELPEPGRRARYDRLVGLDTVKARLRKEAILLADPARLVAWAHRHHPGAPLPSLPLFTDRAPMFVFAGDVGSGKTALAESFGCDLADQLDLPVYLYRLKLSARGSGLVGEMTGLIGDAFTHLHAQGRKARTGKGITSVLVMVVDEADALVQSRQAQQMHHEDRAGVDAFLAGVDGLVGAGVPVLVVLCTNRVGALDPAVMRRAAATFTFTRPGKDQRRAVLTDALHGIVIRPLIRLRDSRTQLLLPRTTPRGPRSNTSQALDRWARAAGLTRAELLDLLAVLRFDLARDPQHLQEHIQLLMLAAGLRTDQAAIHLATDWVARKVRDGHRELTPAMVHQALDELGLHAGTSRAIISIATLTPDLAASDADHALDWVDRFEGDSPYTKRRPRPPATWEQLQRDIEAIPGQLTSGAAAIAITGTFRLAPAFLTGSAFRMVTGVDVGILQRGQLWNSNEAYDAPLVPDIGENELAQGDDLAVAVAIATDPTDDVLTFLREQALPVRRLLTLYPPGGPKDNAVPDAATASALAVGIRDTLRGTLRRASRQTPHIHLFQASPRGLAVLLGHRWNRLRPTTVYEDTATTYDAAFTVDA